MKYILYKTNGEREIIEKEKSLTLEELQELVGGSIEYAPEEENGSRPIVNEDGIGLMLPRNPFFLPKHQAYYVGDIVLGKEVPISAGRNAGSYDFQGFTDEELPLYLKDPVGYSTDLFKPNKVFTIIAIGDFMGQTTRGEVKSTGEMYKNQPVFKENKKGSRKQFVLRNLDAPDTLFFEGTDLPFKIDGEITTGDPATGFTSTIVRGNSLINLAGDPETIKSYIKEKNLNPFFKAYDKINLIEDRETETLLFTDCYTESRMVEERRQLQAKRSK